MATPAFQKGDHVAFKEFPEDVEGRIVGVWKGNAYKVAWDSGRAYRGKTMIVSGNAIRKTAESSRPLTLAHSISRGGIRSDSGEKPSGCA